MGILEFFGTLARTDITSNSIRPDFTQKLYIDHLFIDFNSIIHVGSQAIIADIKKFLSAVLEALYQKKHLTSVRFTDLFAKYKMGSIQKQITPTTPAEKVVELFDSHFDDAYLDKLVITKVINTVLHLIRTYCDNDRIKTVLLAIDGVPSKGKLVEQKQRRYMGAITEQYKSKILHSFSDYLKTQPDYVFTSENYSVGWSRNKITPGTAFMHKLVSYLRSDKIQLKFKETRPKIKLIISDMYEVGEGEKK